MRRQRLRIHVLGERPVERRLHAGHVVVDRALEVGNSRDARDVRRLALASHRLAVRACDLGAERPAERGLRPRRRRGRLERPGGRRRDAARRPDDLDRVRPARELDEGLEPPDASVGRDELRDDHAVDRHLDESELGRGRAKRDDGAHGGDFAEGLDEDEARGGAFVAAAEGGASGGAGGAASDEAAAADTGGAPMAVTCAAAGRAAAATVAVSANTRAARLTAHLRPGRARRPSRRAGDRPCRGRTRATRTGHPVGAPRSG